MAGSQVEVALTQIEKQRLGYQAVSLTNFDTDNEPEIAAGSKVEIGGALFEFSANESITGWGGIGNDNDVYIKLVVDGTSVTAEFTTSAPSWDTAKHGWYDGLDRYIGGLYKDGSGNYTAKYLFDGIVNFNDFVVLDTPGADNWTVPACVYKIRVTIIGAGGAGGTATVSSDSGSGGDTTFNGITASGGAGGHGGRATDKIGEDGSDGFISSNGGGPGLWYYEDSTATMIGTHGIGGEIVKRYFNVSPGDTIAYTVGAGGTAAGGGPAGTVGGGGGDGVIIIELL
jgi:hypothetical protein